MNFILDHAEVDVVFVQDKKVKEVRNQKLSRCCTKVGKCFRHFMKCF